MFVIFDLDGTIANIDHRAHFVRGGRRDWKSFFAACVDDMPNLHVIDTLKAHVSAGHIVRIWSARSDVVRAETEKWLSDYGIDTWRLQHMRAEGDSTPDVELKRYWLNQEYERPDLVYDDRQRVVDMWRAEGIPCFQVVANWEDASSHRIIEPTTSEPLLTLMVGPSGAGKSTWVKNNALGWQVLSTDHLRFEMTGASDDQSRNEDVFLALHRLAAARLTSGLPVTIDATNLRRRDRMALVGLVPACASIQYVVIDRPIADKLATRGWRSEELVRKHHERMQSRLKDILAGDGMANVTVTDMRTANAMARAA